MVKSAMENKPFTEVSLAFFGTNRLMTGFVSAQHIAQYLFMDCL